MANYDANGIWNPDDQFDLDQNNQYQPVQNGAPQPAGQDWSAVEAQLRQAGGNLYDPSDLEGIIRNTSYNEPGKAVSLEQALSNQYNIYNQRAAPSSPQTATSQYSGGNPTAAGAGDAALQQFMQMLQQRDSAQQQQQAQMREILMGQLGQAQQPISADSPGIREILAGGRIGLQRGAERERKNAAELRAYDGSGGLGGKAFDADVSGIQQRQGESEAQMTGQVMSQQLQRQEDKLQRLLTLATTLGDAEAARNIQTQLAAIQTQLQQSNFYDTTAFNYAGLNQQGNLGALQSILGAF
jgi:hypothetical protein